MMPRVREIIEMDTVGEHVILAGTVPQKDTPEYLAACDILVSPHVPNPDDSPFFGSPTKLFEYMAMGKPIVASALGQIAEVLEDGRTAILVKPGNVCELAEAIIKLIRNHGIGETLGRNARKVACERHTWTAHVQKIIDRCKTMGLV